MPYNKAKRDTLQLTEVEREQEVIKLRRAGLAWSQVASQLGFANESGPFKVFRRVLARRLEELNESVDEVRALELDRLDAMLRGGLFAKAQGGDVYAIDRVLKISERRSALLGLDAAKRVEVQVQEELNGAMTKLQARLSNDVFQQVLLALADEVGESPASGSGAGSEAN